MAIINKLTIIMLLGLLLSLYPTVSADPLENSPAPAPHAGADSVPPAPENPPSSSPPAALPETPPTSSPPAPSPGSAPAPAPGGHSADVETPAPAPGGPSDAGSKEDVMAGNEAGEGGGMSGGKKVGIALGVIAAVCVVGAGGFVCKKRQQNIRRSEYGYRGILMEAFSGRD